MRKEKEEWREKSPVLELSGGCEWSYVSTCTFHLAGKWGAGSGLASLWKMDPSSSSWEIP